ncbi:MAG: EAL domain-containing protein [Gammaproteobacteria bacterium]|nr:EAL domain-containing protein [Gammaproteobacteria bacterium]
MLYQIFLLLMLVSCAANASQLDNQDLQRVNELWVYKDHNHHFNQQSIQSIDPSLWQHIDHPNINLGYQSATVWLKFKLTNTTPKPLTRLIDINYPLLDYVTLYQVMDLDKTRILLESGDSLPFSSRKINHPNFVSEIDLAGNSEASFLLKVKSNAPIQMEIKIWESDSFQFFYRSKASLTFLYLGILLSTALFNLVVFLFIKERTYLIYGVYAGSFALLMASQDAILFEYIFPNHPAYHNWSQLILGAATLSLTCLFNLVFLQLNKQDKGRLLYIFSFIPIGIILSGFAIDYAFAIKALVLSIIIIVPACFIIGFIHSKQNENRGFYLIAWTWLLTGVVIFALAKLGIFPFNLFTNHAIQLGSTLELLTFAIALAKRLHTEKETRIQAQQIIIDSSRQSAMLQQELLYNATHNDVTGLPNRNHFSSWIDQHIKQQKGFTVVLMRLSRIAELDKTLGRKISNYALEQFALILNSEIQSLTDIQCIDIQEDFYAANLSNSTLGFVINTQDPDIIKKELIYLQETINQPININEMQIDPWVLTGFARYPEHGTNSQMLLRNAGIALDSSHNGDHQICSYHHNLDTYNERRLTLINELKAAVANNEMALHYQPLICTGNKQIIGAEALIRWPHAEYGTIMPDEFIEIAEQTGIIQALSLWVFKSALHQLINWQKNNPDFLMSINISTHNIQDPHFISALSLIINDHKHLTKNMILEITESQMMSDTLHAFKNLWTLSEMGFVIAIDDFGTGYSNLGHLKKLPANELKIDKTFILNLEDDNQNQVLVQTAIHMAHNLGMSVVAEGVESERCYKLLKDMGCDMCQGYHFSRPVPAEQFNSLMKQVMTL